MLFSVTLFPGMAQPTWVTRNIPGGSAVKAQPHSLYHETFLGQSPRHSAESFYLPAGDSPSYATTEPSHWPGKQKT